MKGIIFDEVVFDPVDPAGTGKPHFTFRPNFDRFPLHFDLVATFLTSFSLDFPTARPWGKDYYYCRGVHGLASNDTWPVPPCFLNDGK